MSKKLPSKSQNVKFNSVTTPNQTCENDQLILGVREQVKKFVMRKVAMQLTNMELLNG